MKQAISNSFAFFMAWLNAQKLINSQIVFKIDDVVLGRWLKYYVEVLNVDDKVVYVESLEEMNADFEVFIALYMFYLSLYKSDSTIISIGSSVENKNLIYKILKIDSIISDSIEVPKHIIATDHNYVKFSNESIIKFQTVNTYTLRNMQELDLVYFGFSQIKNEEKISYDISEMLTSSLTNKAIIATSELDIKEKFPEIKIVQLNEK